MNRGPLPPMHPSLLKAMLDDPLVAEGVAQLSLGLFDYCSPWVEWSDALDDFEVRYWMGEAHTVPVDS